MHGPSFFVLCSISPTRMHTCAYISPHVHNSCDYEAHGSEWNLGKVQMAPCCQFILVLFLPPASLIFLTLNFRQAPELLPLLCLCKKHQTGSLPHCPLPPPVSYPPIHHFSILFTWDYLPLYPSLLIVYLLPHSQLECKPPQLEYKLCGQSLSAMSTTEFLGPNYSLASTWNNTYFWCPNLDPYNFLPR